MRLEPRTRPRAIGRRHRDRSYLGKGKAFDEAIAEFADAYADQNEADYRTLVEATESGRVAATTGV